MILTTSFNIYCFYDVTLLCFETLEIVMLLNETSFNITLNSLKTINVYLIQRPACTCNHLWIRLFDLKYFQWINCKCLLNIFLIRLSLIYSQSIHLIDYRCITKSSSRQDYEINLRSIPSQSFWIYWAIDLRTITL